MASDRDSSSSFDTLWNLEDDDSALPPALDPRQRPGASRPAATLPPEARPTAPPPAFDDEDRETLLPGEPQRDYVRKMMELAEVDESDELLRRTRPERVDTFGGSAPEHPDVAPSPALGLVLAKENELLHPDDAGPAKSPSPAERPAAPTARPKPAPAGGSFTMGETPKPPAQPVMKSAGFRTTALGSRGAPVIPGAPAPRAPSVPPGPDEDDPLAALDALDALDPVSPRAGRRTPARGRRSSPSQRARLPSTAGIRLLKPSADPEPSHGDRVTPPGPTPGDEPAPSSVRDNVREMQSRLAAGNYPGALVLAESVLASAPGHVAAKQTAERCREKLAEKYLSSLGDRNAIPRVAMAQEEMRWLGLDHRAGFLLSFIDGATTIGEVLDGSSMSELEALRIMFELKQQGAIEIQSPPRRAGRK